MGDKNRLNVFPTSMNLMNTKNSLNSARKGHYLLKRMADSLKIQKRKLENKIEKESEDVNAQIMDAHMSLSKAKYHSNDIRSFVFECSKFPVQLESTTEQVAGIKTVVFKLKSLTTSKATCLGKGGISLLNARNSFVQVLEKIIFLHTIKASYKKLDDALKATNRRVNALENFMIPRYENTINYIIEELDEQAREEFFRLKKIKGKKK